MSLLPGLETSSTLPAMKTIFLSAKFDGEHIRLEDGYPLKRNARLLVTVLPDGDIGDAAFREYIGSTFPRWL